MAGNTECIQGVRTTYSTSLRHQKAQQGHILNSLDRCNPQASDQLPQSLHLAAWLMATSAKSMTPKGKRKEIQKAIASKARLQILHHSMPAVSWTKSPASEATASLRKQASTRIQLRQRKGNIVHHNLITDRHTFSGAKKGIFHSTIFQPASFCRREWIPACRPIERRTQQDTSV